jgi:hypothetical protein
MLEVGEFLQTWALNELPRDWQLDADHGLSNSNSNSVDAERLADHRLAYLDYEGPVSGDRGSVRQLDAGTFCELQEPLSFSLAGQIICGRVDLLPMDGDSSKWQLRFTRQ